MSVRDLDDYLRHIQNNMHPLFIKNIAKEMQEKDKEIKRLKEEYMILQNASDEVEEDKNKEIERLNKQLQLISDEFLKYDWENSSKEQMINQLKSLYNSIFKGSDKE